MFVIILTWPITPQAQKVEHSSIMEDNDYGPQQYFIYPHCAIPIKSWDSLETYENNPEDFEIEIMYCNI